VRKKRSSRKREKRVFRNAEGGKQGSGGEKGKKEAPRTKTAMPSRERGAQESPTRTGATAIVAHGFLPTTKRGKEILYKGKRPSDAEKSQVDWEAQRSSEI